MDWRGQGAPTPLNTTADPPPFDFPDGGIGSVSFGLEDSTLDSSNDCQDGADKEKSGESAEVEAVAMAGAVHGNPAHAITEPLVPPCPPVEMDTDASAPPVPDSLPPATPLARSNVWVPLDRGDELVRYVRTFDFNFVVSSPSLLDIGLGVARSVLQTRIQCDWNAHWSQSAAGDEPRRSDTRVSPSATPNVHSNVANPAAQCE